MSGTIKDTLRDEDDDVGDDEDEFSEDYVTGDVDPGYDEYPADDEPDELDFDDKNDYRSPRNNW